MRRPDAKSEFITVFLTFIVILIGVAVALVLFPGLRHSAHAAESVKSIVI